ncbi:MAG: hypothetical protein R3B90_08985 [Planctomycetaceae bacterium]
MTWATRGVLAGLGLAGLFVVTAAGPVPVAQGVDHKADAMTETSPVETDMHEFMEYAFQEPYKRLVANLKQAPADRAGWKIIKSDALLLAEAGNLLLMRGPEEHRDLWAKHSVEVRELGSKLYAAGKARSYDDARPAWEALIKSCNSCHDSFADGEHQLQP